MASSDSLKVLPSGAGYGIIIGIGGVFAIVMLGITWLQNRYVRHCWTAKDINKANSNRLASLPNRPKSSAPHLDLSSLV